jgi:branched-chain amino acid transport system ATP-binding protein
MTQPLLETKNLIAHYDKVLVLKDINIYVNPGELIVVVGGNGAGKSTLLKCISGLHKITEGSVHFISRLPTHLVARKGVSLVPEGRMIFGNQSVLENLILGAHWCRKKASRQEIEADIEACFQRFPILKERQSSLAGSLSGGEQQMLAISRGLMSKPSLLLIDEPSVGLAPIIIQQVFETIRSLQRGGLSILLVEQMARMALQIADRGYILENGNVIKEGSGKSLIDDEHIVECYLGRD